MEIKDKIKHLENLKSKIKGMYLNEMNIKSLSKLIQKELLSEKTSKNSSRLYINNLEQTIDKQLDILVSSRKKPNNRITEFNEVRDNFIMDINRELGDLKY